MSALTRLSPARLWDKGGEQTSEHPVATPRFELTVALLSAAIVVGFVVDLWAHSHGRADESFFTPWHALLYGAMAVTGIFLVAALLRNRAAGYAWQRALPAGYGLCLVGVALFAFAGLLDMAWHLVFGIEVSLDALMSPTHLLLAVAGCLIVLGPLRSAWLGSPVSPAPPATAMQRQGWGGLAPALISATALLVILASFTQYAHPLVSPEAAKSEARPVNSDIYAMNADGSAQIRLTGNPQENGWGPAFSPDGKHMVFSIAVHDTEGTELYLANIDGSNPTQLTHNGRSNYLPAWSPDSKRISFISQVADGTSTAEVFVIDVDGRNERQLTDSNAQEYGTSWSPDGKRIAFGSSMDGSWRVYIASADGSGASPLPGAESGNAPAWSPDGKLIAFASDRDGSYDIYVVSAEGGEARRLTQGNGRNGNPAWSPDGKSIAFESTRDGNNEIYVMNADGSGLTNLTNNAGTESLIPTWSADGRRIAYTAAGHSSEPSQATTEALGIAGILLQSAILMGVLLMVAHGWKLPPGAFTLLIGLSSLAMVTLQDQYALFPAALLAGIVADLLYMLVRPSTDPAGKDNRAGEPWRFHMFAALVPVVFFGLYFATLLATVGVRWSVHMTVGSILLAGIVGLLASYLVLEPVRRKAVEAKE